MIINFKFKKNDEVKIISGKYKGHKPRITGKRSNYFFVNITTKSSKQKDKYIKIHRSNLLKV